MSQMFSALQRSSLQPKDSLSSRTGFQPVSLNHLIYSLVDSLPIHKPGSQTWELHARPKDAKHELWQTRRVAARSAIQAQAILRRQGYEAVLETALVVDAQPEPKTIAKLQPVRCVRCNYLLTGLSIESSHVTCPECAYQQPIVAWNPNIQTRVDHNHPVIWIFTYMGMVAFGLVALVFILAIVS